MKIWKIIKHFHQPAVFCCKKSKLWERAWESRGARWGVIGWARRWRATCQLSASVWTEFRSMSSLVLICTLKELPSDPLLNTKRGQNQFSQFEIYFLNKGTSACVPVMWGSGISYELKGLCGYAALKHSDKSQHNHRRFKLE